MQAIIMAAGKGSRLGKLTEEMPKSFLEINGKKLIEYSIDILHKYGIWDITIVIGYRDTDFRDLLGNVPGIRFVYNPFFEMVNVIGSFYMGMDNLHDDFIFMHADTLCDTGIFEDMLLSEGDMVMPVDMKQCGEEEMKVRVKDGKIVELTKKMDPSLADGEFIGIMKVKGRILNELKQTVTALMRERVFGEYFEAAISRMMDTGEYDVRIIETAGRFWGEIDFADDYKAAAANISKNLLEL